ncbi:MAG: hypothetical protein HXX20_18535, partial [Chloroflexi bacterium]|nr:hypothetical protein [Chloroflexota bacterium]
MTNSENITLPKNDYPECSRKMLQCATMADTDRRKVVVSQLPSNIIHRISHDNTPLIYVYNIVESCAWFPCGIDQLVVALYKVEGKSKAWEELEQYLRPFAHNRQVVPTEILEFSPPPLRPPEQPQGNTNSGSGTQFNVGSQQAGRDINQGNTYSLSGDASKSNINLNSKLENVTQNTYNQAPTRQRTCPAPPPPPDHFGGRDLPLAE